MVNETSETFLDKMNSIITGVEFEGLLKLMFEEMKYHVELTNTTNDQGADLIITKGNNKTVIQAKFYSGTVGNSAVQEVVAAIKYYSASRGMVITNSSFTNSAISLARVNDIMLINGYDLKVILEIL